MELQQQTPHPLNYYNDSLLITSVVDNGSCFNHTCNAQCQRCSQSARHCVAKPCGFINIHQHCGCPRLSEETLIAVGAVVLLLLMLLTLMAVWHWWRCGDGRRTTTMTENLLNANYNFNGGPLGGGGLPPPRRSRGRTSIDSCISCVVCMDGQIDCVLMPCAHEVACLRCAQRLGLCPICRNAVTSTLKLKVADAADRERALYAMREEIEGHGEEDEDEEMQSPSQASTASPPTGAAAAAAAEEMAEAVAGSEEAPKDHGGVKPPSSAGGDVLPSMLCLRCAAKPPNCVFLPCSHKVWCVDCAASLPPVCPVCSTGITQSLKTFHKRL